MMLAEQNKHGGQLGNKIEPVVVDPASNWPRFAEKTVELLEKDKVAVVFGRSTSASRKSALPVFKKDDGLLFSPVQYGVRNPQRTYLRGTASQSAGDSRRRNMSDEVMRIAAAFWAVRS